MEPSQTEKARPGAPGSDARPTRRRRRASARIGSFERALRIVAGGAIIVTGARRRSLLGLLLMAGGASVAYRGVTGRRAVGRRRSIPRAVDAHKAITVTSPADEVYRFWRDFENLANVMGHVTSIRAVDERVFHWKLRQGPFRVEYDTEIFADEAERRIGWRSLPDGAVPQRGEVTFKAAPGDRGTEVHLRIEFLPPGGAKARPLHPILRRLAELELAADLARFRQLLEAGELASAAIRRADVPERLKRLPSYRSRELDQTVPS